MLHCFKQYSNKIKSLEQGSSKMRYQNAQTDKDKKKKHSKQIFSRQKLPVTSQHKLS